ncbi:MAG: bifunctional 3,4-dihydroxy-2-butanone-4-phosphate synthase/GTP cyclohydrolase II [Bacteroidales bacterium]
MSKEINTIEEAIEDIKDGKFVIVVDDEDRENEGDFIIASEKITPEAINFMATHGRGLICTSLSETRCKELNLELMVSSNTALHETPFTISVDAIHPEVTTGISASDRAITIKMLIDTETKAEHLGRPGHIFPLRAKEKGVLRRSGHTEASLDLANLAGLYPSGTMVEIMNEDGTMARMPQLIELSKRFDIKIVTIKDLIVYRLQRESLIERGETVEMPTEYGTFKLTPYRQISNGLEHVAITKGSWTDSDAVLVRVHSSCATGDIFASKRCDCGEQLHQALKTIEDAGQGVVLYMNQEGRGIGLMNKMKAYKLQEEGLDTVEANIHLGFKADERDYGVGAQILRDLGISKMRLLTNNPVKRIGIEAYGLSVKEIVPIEVAANPHNEFYMKTKKDKMGHDLNKLK